MKQIIRLSLLCAAFAGCSAVFANTNGGNDHFASDCKCKKEYTKTTEISIRFNSHLQAFIERYVSNFDNISIPENVTHIANLSIDKMHDEGKKPKKIRDVDYGVRKYNTRSKKLAKTCDLQQYNTTIENWNPMCDISISSYDRFTNSMSSRTSSLNNENCYSLVSSLMHRCKPFYYKESLTSCYQVKRGIYHSNDSIFYSIGDGERVTININLPNGSIITLHFPD